MPWSVTKNGEKTSLKSAPYPHWSKTQPGLQADECRAWADAKKARRAQKARRDAARTALGRFSSLEALFRAFPTHEAFRKQMIQAGYVDQSTSSQVVDNTEAP